MKLHMYKDQYSLHIVTEKTTLAFSAVKLSALDESGNTFWLIVPLLRGMFDWNYNYTGI